jgi:hypothetical protein
MLVYRHYGPASGMTDSSTGGFLTPASSPAPLEGDGLNTFVQPIIVGLTGLPGPMVRPAFQSEPPDAPDGGQAWAAFRYTSRRADTFPYVQHNAAGNGSDTLRRHEEIDILVSFYDLGTSGLADYYAALLRDGFAISQNLEVLRAAGMGFISCGDMTTVPMIVKQRWLYRVDLPFSIRREIVRTYSVLNILSATATLKTNSGVSVSISTD